MRYSDYEQRQMDIASGLELDRREAQEYRKGNRPARYPVLALASTGMVQALSFDLTATFTHDLAWDGIWRKHHELMGK